MKLVLLVSVLSSVYLTSSAQKCKEFVFPNQKVFANCTDLSQSSYIHWTSDPWSVKIAFRHSGITLIDRWVAWGINANNNMNTSMIGAQVIVVKPQLSGAPKLYATHIGSYHTHLEEGDFLYPYDHLEATYQNNEVTIYGTFGLPKGTTSLVHLWQDGPLVGSVPHRHELDDAHLHSKAVLNLI